MGTDVKYLKDMSRAAEQPGCECKHTQSLLLVRGQASYIDNNLGVCVAATVIASDCMCLKAPGCRGDSVVELCTF